MKWATREHIHFDRMATAWLIARFVDPDAEFLFCATGDAVPDDARAFGIPGPGQSFHENGQTAFRRVLEDHRVEDGALGELAEIVADAVAHVLNDSSRADLVLRHPDVSGLLSAAEGMMLLSRDDRDYRDRGFVLLDAFYARLQVRLAIEQVQPAPPASILAQTEILSDCVRAARATQGPCSGGDVAAIVRNGAAMG